ncbi:MAG: nucleotidyltransferase domain-containing protein [Candidatus Brocadiaceae bacterium]|nr:nucleotidyltransferase domain-containing protein [Candidatus Brocadiaceae bacterium]
MNDKIVEHFLELIHPCIADIEEIYLFGSRCRDDWRPDSDYDILIVLGKKDRVIIDRLYDAVMDILLSTTKLVSLKIFTSLEFNRLKSIPTPFISNVTTKGIKLGIHN